MSVHRWFFFSSRRRHTRFDCDWSSDVCSSDLHDVYGDDLQRLHTRGHQFNFYAQDEWKVRTDLTMTYGLRWENNPPAFDAQGGTFVPDKFIDGSQGLVTFVKADGWWKRSNWNAFAPRVGI